MKATPVYYTVDPQDCDEINCCLPNPFAWRVIVPSSGTDVIIGEGGEAIEGEGNETFPENQP